MKIQLDHNQRLCPFCSKIVTYKKAHQAKTYAGRPCRNCSFVEKLSKHHPSHKCPDCPAEFHVKKNVFLHGVFSHGWQDVDEESAYSRIVLGSLDKPTCQCGCGEQVNYVDWANGFVRFVIGHNAKAETEIMKNARVASISASFVSGKSTSWCKGLTKETDSRVAARGQATAVGRQAAFDAGSLQIWHKGLTKKTDPRVKAMGESISTAVAGKVVSGEWPRQVGFESGWHESPKCGSQYYRSSYERRYFVILDADVDVVSYKSEPFSLPYTFNGEAKNYVPDVIVTRVSCRQQLVEVKPSSLVSNPKTMVKLSVGRSWCLNNNVDFVVVTEKDL